MRNQANEWLRRVRDLEEVKTKVGADVLADPVALKAMRFEIKALKSEMSEIERAPTKVENLEGQARAYVKSLAKIGAPSTCVIEQNGQIKTDFSDVGYSKAPHCLFAWLALDLMENRLISEIKERIAQTGRTPMTADDRERWGNELRSKLEKLERKDAALTVAALESENSRHHVSRRSLRSGPSFGESIAGARSHRTRGVNTWPWGNLRHVGPDGFFCFLHHQGQVKS
jgi:hypothetical protein